MLFKFKKQIKEEKSAYKEYMKLSNECKKCNLPRSNCKGCNVLKNIANDEKRHSDLLQKLRGKI